MEKSYVGLEQHQCPICLTLFDTGTVLLDRRLRATLERHQLTGHSPCPDCTSKIDEGYIALVETTEEAHGDRAGLNTPRSGNVAWIRRAVFDQVFNVPAPVQSMCFIDPTAFAKLRSMAP